MITPKTMKRRMRNCMQRISGTRSNKELTAEKKKRKSASNSKGSSMTG